jgi:transglutaminase-like putative cysteine protease
MLVAAIAPVVITWYAVAYRWSARAFAIVVFYSAVWWSAIVVNPHRTVLGIVPTPPGLVVWLHGIFDAPHVLRTAVVPVPPVGHALELAVFAFWIAAAGTAWSAVKHDGVLIALLPSFALFVTISSLGKGAYVFTTTLWCAAAGAFLLVQHADAALRARTGFQAVAAHRSRLLSGGATAAVLAILFGAIVGPLLPEASSAPLLDYRGHGGNSSQIVDISPLLGIGDQLRQPKSVQLFTVAASSPARWRLMALDEFNGAYWGLQETSTTTSIPPDNAPHLANVAHTPVIQQYSIGPMGGKFLPAAYRAENAPDLSNLVVIPDSATLVVNDENHQGLNYAVTSSLVGASPTTLREVPSVDTRDPMIAQNLQLPSSFAPRISNEAKRIVAAAHATTEYDKALALQTYFRDPKRFKYDQNVNLSESTNAMEDFLFDVRRGFCEQFAGTYAAMARAVGLPTRVAVGFQTGALVKQGTNADGSQILTYSVTTKEAHAWPEVYFPRVGWIAFEPTPGRYDYNSPDDPNGTALNAPPYQAGATGTAGRGGSTTTVATTVAPNNGSSPSAGARPPGRLDITPPATTGTTKQGGGTISLWLLIPAILVAAMALAVAMIALLQHSRRWRRAHAPTTRARVDGAWTQVTEDLARRDIRRRPAATLVEFALREAPAAGAGAAGPPLLELAQLQTRSMYGIDEPAADDADRAWACADKIATALRAETPRRERIRQMFGLGPRRRRKRRPLLRTV